MGSASAEAARNPVDSLLELVPQRWRSFANPRRDLPKLARDPSATARIEALLGEVPTRHELFLGDSRATPPLAPESIHLVVTSPPYWTLKEYPVADGQLGWVEDYEDFLDQLDLV